MCERSLQVRPARPDDAERVAPLIFEIMGPYNFLWAAESRAEALQVIASLFRQPGNRFSHQHTLVAETGGEPRGFITSYPSGRLAWLDLRTGLRLMRLRGAGRCARRLAAHFRMLLLKEARRGEHYIYLCGVFPGHRGQGVAACLVRHVEAVALAADSSRCSALVDVGNNASLRFCDKLGYRDVEVLQLGGEPRCHRLVKTLGVRTCGRS